MKIVSGWESLIYSWNGYIAYKCVFLLLSIVSVMSQVQAQQQLDVEIVRSAVTEAERVADIEEFVAEIEEVKFVANKTSDYLKTSRYTTNQKNRVREIVEMASKARAQAWMFVQEAKAKYREELDLAIQNAKTDAQRDEFKRKAMRASNFIDFALSVASQSTAIYNQYSEFDALSTRDRYIDEAISEIDSEASDRLPAGGPGQPYDRSLEESLLDPLDMTWGHWVHDNLSRYANTRDGCYELEEEYLESIYPSWEARLERTGNTNLIIKYMSWLACGETPPRRRSGLSLPEMPEFERQQPMEQP